MADRTRDVKRLFIAVNLDEPTRVQVAAVSSGLASVLTMPEGKPFAPGDAKAISKPLRMTWVPPTRLHLTLAFFGEADPELECGAIAALAEPVAITPFDLAFGGLGWFPARGSPKVLWLGVARGAQQLVALHDVLAGRLRSPLGRSSHETAGIFRPHLTIARFRDRVPPAVVRKLPTIPAAAGPCRIDRVTLYESRLSPKGPAYSVLAEAALEPCR